MSALLTFTLKTYSKEDLVQGTEQWKEARKARLTGSQFKSLMTEKTQQPTKNLSSIIYSIQGQTLINSYCESELKDDYKKAAARRGNDLEPEARNRYQKETCELVEEVGFIEETTYNLLGFSPDGFVGDDKIIEIKCLCHANYYKYLKHCITTQTVPADFTAQVQGGLYLTGRKECDFILYHPEAKKPFDFYMLNVKRDEEYIAKFDKQVRRLIKELEEERKFFDQLLSKD